MLKASPFPVETPVRQVAPIDCADSCPCRSRRACPSCDVFRFPGGEPLDFLNESPDPPLDVFLCHTLPSAHSKCLQHENRESHPARPQVRQRRGTLGCYLRHVSPI